eukprot:1786022-Pyramimonas_sp.AAC.1
MQKLACATAAAVALGKAFGLASNPCVPYLPSSAVLVMPKKQLLEVRADVFDPHWASTESFL